MSQRHWRGGVRGGIGEEECAEPRRGQRGWRRVGGVVSGDEEDGGIGKEEEESVVATSARRSVWRRGEDKEDANVAAASLAGTRRMAVSARMSARSRGRRGGGG